MNIYVYVYIETLKYIHTCIKREREKVKEKEEIILD